MIKQITIQDCRLIIGIMIALMVLVVGWFIASAEPTQEHTQRIVYLKNGGEFANWCRVSDNTDYDRVINLHNIAVMRKVADKRLELDGKVVILFKDNQEREMFIKGGQENGNN